MKVMVTGAAGFIGSALSLRLLQRGDEVVGVDNLNDYYDVNLKKDRLSRLGSSNDFQFQQIDIVDREAMSALFSSNEFDAVVNLAAQAGVRYSIENPFAYIDTNLVG
ncbi:MAG: GDP-mannose 4,6-dehydratase, partial [Arenicellales bacterium]|nr:GDP-mannose 4,6-dehydratase [Arenicellales bacterium]